MRLDRGAVKLLTRTGLDWTLKYPAIAAAVASLPAKQAYLDGELCGVRPDGTTSFGMIQLASDSGNAAALVFFLFDLLSLNGEDLATRPLIERKEQLAALLAKVTSPLHYSDHQIGRGWEFHKQACAVALEGIVSKRADAPYTPGKRGLWVKTKCLHREEFIVVGWTDPEGSRPWLGSLLLAYYDPEGRLVYAGRAGTGIKQAELERLWRRLQPLAVDKMPLEVLPPRTSRFGSPLVLSRVHWVRPELVAEVKFLTWTDENLLRQVVYEGLREDKPAAEIRRPVPNSQPTPATNAPAAVPKSTTRGSAGPRRPRTAVPPENILQLLPDAAVPSRDALAEYWTKVAPRALRYLARRPLKLVRHLKGDHLPPYGTVAPAAPFRASIAHPEAQGRGRGPSLGGRSRRSLGAGRDRRRRVAPLGRYGRRYRASRPAGLRSRSRRRHHLEFRDRDRVPPARHAGG
jgi:bifunctional non-homologous end joining protein LigD